MYALNKTLKYMKQKLIEFKRGTYNSTMILQDFNTRLSAIDRNTTQKTNKDRENLSIIISQQDCADI